VYTCAFFLFVSNDTVLSRVFLFFGSLTVVGVLTSVGTAVGRRRFFFGIQFSDYATKFLSNESAVKWSSHTTLLLLNINVSNLNLPFFKLFIHCLHNLRFTVLFVGSGIKKTLFLHFPFSLVQLNA
jgi:hypothetical protein